MTETRFKSMKDLPSEHLLGAGTAMCAGCGGLEAVKEIYDVLGTNTVFVNAAGCMTLLSVYPFTPFRGSWLYTAMASAPASASAPERRISSRADGQSSPMPRCAVSIASATPSPRSHSRCRNRRVASQSTSFSLAATRCAAA